MSLSNRLAKLIQRATTAHKPAREDLRRRAVDFAACVQFVMYCGTPPSDVTAVWYESLRRFNLNDVGDAAERIARIREWNAAMPSPSG